MTATGAAGGIDRRSAADRLAPLPGAKVLPHVRLDWHAFCFRTTFVLCKLPSRKERIMVGAMQEQQAEFAGGEGELVIRCLLQHLPVAAYTCDAQGLITFCNARAVELWGREPKLNDPVDRY
jgi:PAS domain-containing protein